MGTEQERIRIGLVACSKTKRPGIHPARELYSSPLFRSAAEYAQRHYQRWYVLSAAYGLVFPDTPIPTYDVTLSRLSARERRQWARGVHDQLLIAEGTDRTYCFHAGRLYRETLADLLRQSGATIEEPLRGLQIGEQLAWYARRRQVEGWNRTR
jgi:hypothetical protein